MRWLPGQHKQHFPAQEISKYLLDCDSYNPQALAWNDAIKWLPFTKTIFLFKMEASICQGREDKAVSWLPIESKSLTN